jgi:hypothetical protein
MAISPGQKGTHMFKKTLIASALVVSTFAAFAQAPASTAAPVPATAATKKTEAAKLPAAAEAKPNTNAQVIKQVAKKAKHVRVISTRAKKKMQGATKPVAQNTPVKP